jgi:hypothetical protein
MGVEVHSLLDVSAKFGGRECRVSEAWETATALFIRIEGDEGFRATMTLEAAIQHGVVDVDDVPASLRPIVEEVVRPAPRVVGRRLPQRSGPETPLRFGRLRSD